MLCTFPHPVSLLIWVPKILSKYTIKITFLLNSFKYKVNIMQALGAEYQRWVNQLTHSKLSVSCFTTLIFNISKFLLVTYSGSLSSCLFYIPTRPFYIALYAYIGFIAAEDVVGYCRKVTQATRLANYGTCSLLHRLNSSQHTHAKVMGLSTRASCVCMSSPTGDYLKIWGTVILPRNHLEAD